MAATTGIAFLIKTDTISGTAATVGGQRDGTLVMTSGSVDISDKQGSGWVEKINGLKEWSVTGNGVVLEDDTQFALLDTDFIAGNKVVVSVALPQTTATFDGNAIIQSISRNAPHDDVYTWDVSLEGDGALTKS